jgi:RNA polymerase sigma-70 factor (ECF subfamily)
MDPIAPGTPSVRTELIAQAAWVRGLARSLVRDDVDAEDLAQDALVVALRKPPSGEGSLRPWLLRVTRNLAAMRARRVRPRDDVDLGVAADARPTDDVAERLEVQKVLTEELDRLDEPYRSTLVRRYLEGWSAARIARAEKIPAATVRSRVQRGLELLRARLDRRFGCDRAGWQRALLPLCAGPSALVPLALFPFQGLMVMKIGIQVGAACVLVAVAGLGVWLWTSESPEAARPAQPETARVLEREPAIEPATADTASGLRAPADESTRAARPIESPQASLPATVARIEARCVDRALRPLSGATFLVHDSAPPASARSADDGRVVLELDLGAVRAQRVLRVVHPSHATTFVEASFAGGVVTHLGDIVLAPGGSVIGSVEDAAGRPVEGAWVWIRGTDIWGGLEYGRRNGPSLVPHVPGGASGPDGGFVVAGVEIGERRAWAHAPGMRWTISEPISVDASRASEPLRLVLEPFQDTDRILGAVVTQDGEGVANALLYVSAKDGGGRSSKTQTCDGEGRFEIAVLSGEPHDIEASDPSGKRVESTLADVAPGARDARIVLGEARFTTVTVLSQGKPVTRFAVVTRSQGGATLIAGTGDVERADGRARVRAPGVPYLIQAVAPGFALESRGPFDPQHPPQELEFELSPEPCLTGRVTSEAGPVQGAVVELFATSGKTVLEINGYPSLVQPYALATATTDTEGRYRMRVVSDGRFVVSARAHGRATTDAGPLDLRARTAEVVDLVFLEGGRIEGRVLVREGRSPAGIVVVANRGDAHPFTVRTDESGGFRFTQLTPGRWRVARGEIEVFEGAGIKGMWSGKAREIEFNCDVEPGKTTHFELDLAAVDEGVLLGRLTLSGAPARGWTVTVWPENGPRHGRPPSSAVREDGSFEIGGLEPERSKLLIQPPAELGDEAPLEVLRTIVPGDNTWSMDLALGSVEGRIGETARSVPGEILLVTDDGVQPARQTVLAIGEDGGFRVRFCPAGRASLTRFVAGPTGWVTTPIASVDVRANETAHVDVP